MERSVLTPPQPLPASEEGLQEAVLLARATEWRVESGEGAEGLSEIRLRVMFRKLHDDGVLGT